MFQNKFNNNNNHAKNIIFLTGGVCSGVGKGIALSSLAALLKSLGYKVRVKKFDPYLNVDSGTLSPYQHGEVFVTADGVETDMDNGHYERFTDQKTQHTDYMTSGKMYWEILHKERAGGYDGNTVQVFPHVTDHVQEAILKNTDGIDFLLCEIGGTIGDLEGAAIYEAARILSSKVNSMFIHVAHLLYISTTDEIKTKPVQHSVRMLLALGIQPNLIICRSETKPDSDSWKEKIATFANLQTNNIILGENVNNTYEMLCMYSKSGLLENVCNFFNIECQLQNNKQLQEYEKNNQIAQNTQDEITIAIVGKYISLQDSYKSVKEALFYSSTLAKHKLKLIWIQSEKLYDQDQESWNELKQADGILIPGGFGLRGAEGMILAIQFARENNIPLLGICLGMQLIAIEFSRNVCKLASAGSAEFVTNDNQYEHNIVDLIDKLMPDVAKSETVSKITHFIRLGEYESKLKPDSQLSAIYEQAKIHERFRHRYELNKKYLSMMNAKGLTATAVSKLEANQDIDFQSIDQNNQLFIDGLELQNHKFFIGVQYHPEFLSKPLKGHPLFNAFINKCIE